jgi:glycosyltransferase involved in cell wall biosynthesis
MIFRLWPMIRWADVIHLTAVYSSPTIPTLFFLRMLGKPVVWSPRGALQRWEGATKPLIKRAWEWICNALISRKNCVLHVTSDQETTDSKARLSNSDITLIPNGVDIPEALPARTWLPKGKLRLLYLGRLHKIKGIENLLRALYQLKDESISLTICGTGDEAYSLSLRHLVYDLGLEQCVSFQGHVNGEEKMKAFMQADVCVVPSFTENFGMVVAEALAHGVPVIASKGTPWAELERRDCGLWVENLPQSLAHAIRVIRDRNPAEMGRRGRLWMANSFGWEGVAKAMFDLYRQCMNDRRD